jgi:hypothetical protein
VRKGTKNGDHGPGQGEPPAAALAHAARRMVVFHRYQKHPRRGVVNGVGRVFPEGVIAPFPMSYTACCPGCATCALSS